MRVSITLATTQTRGLYRRWGIKTAREYARIKIDGLRLVGGNLNPGPDFTNAPGHGDDDARFYDRQQVYIDDCGGWLPRRPSTAAPKTRIDYRYPWPPSLGT